MREDYRRSNYDLRASLNYVRLAFKSASRDQDAANETVKAILAGCEGDTDMHKRELIRAFALALAAVMATTDAEAACHHYSIWRNPWPQSCAATEKAAAVSLRGRGAAAADRTWYVEITRPPIDNDAEARSAGIDALKRVIGDGKGQ